MVRDTNTLPRRRSAPPGCGSPASASAPWAIGGGGWTFAWGNQDDADSIAAIRHAVERGIN